MESNIERIVHEDCIEIKEGTQSMFVSPEMEKAILSHPKVIDGHQKLKVLGRAKRSYAKHLGLDSHGRDTLWPQASAKYRQCFIDIATMELEDEELFEGGCQ